ncbi:50S ribosomal protein L32e [Candidatus Bathyarchaeota archaeon]|nr:50S ribosomal protein L32e [Candidatus Bathyarchaeota archaeon]
MSEPKTAVLEREKALRLRAKIKKKKPDFVRQESWRYDRLKENWRRPKGIDNKMRRKIKGWPPTVNVGYRGPKAARGLHPSGYEEVIVCNVEDLKKVDPKTQAVRIAHTVGKRKRMQIIQEAKKKKITILNLSEVKEEVKKAPVEKEEKEEAKEGEGKEEKVEETAEKEKSKAERKRTKKPSEVEGGKQEQ